MEEGSSIEGCRLRDVCGDATPLLLVRANGAAIPSPEGEEVLKTGDAVVLYSEPSELREGRRP